MWREWKKITKSTRPPNSFCMNGVEPYDCAARVHLKRTNWQSVCRNWRHATAKYDCPNLYIRLRSVFWDLTVPAYNWFPFDPQSVGRGGGSAYTMQFQNFSQEAPASGYALVADHVTVLETAPVSEAAWLRMWTGERVTSLKYPPVHSLIHRSISLSVCLSVCICNCLSLSLSVYVCMYVCVYIYLSIYLSIYLENVMVRAYWLCGKSEMRKILLKNPVERKSLGKLIRRLEDNIKIDCREIGCDDVN
jgi:hypothetical protein